MSEAGKKNGRLSWVITLLEVIVVIAYFAIGFGGIAKAAQNMDFVGIFESVETAIWFLVVATAIITVLCFIPIFRTKWTIFIGIWNVVWLYFSIKALIG